DASGDGTQSVRRAPGIERAEQAPRTTLVPTIILLLRRDPMLHRLLLIKRRLWFPIVLGLCSVLVTAVALQAQDAATAPATAESTPAATSEAAEETAAPPDSNTLAFAIDNV